jgi:O-antigen ligase
VYFGLKFKSDRFRVASILGLLAIGTGFEFLTGERVAFAMFLFGSLIVFVGLWITHPDQRRFMAGTGAALVLLLGIGVSTQPKMVDRTINSLAAGAMGYASQPGGRILASALTIWEDHPALGIGIKNFETTCPEYLERGEAPECNVHPHNIYIQWLVESGAIGLGLFVALVASLFIAVWRDRKDRSGPMLPLFASVVMLTSLWPFMGSMGFFNNWIAAVIWMGIGWALATTEGAPAPHANAGSS